VPVTPPADVRAARVQLDRVSEGLDSLERDKRILEWFVGDAYPTGSGARRGGQVPSSDVRSGVRQTHRVNERPASAIPNDPRFGRPATRARGNGPADHVTEPEPPERL